MSRAEIRHVPLSDASSWLKSMKSTFMEDPKLDFTEAQQAWWASIWDSERIRGGYADGRWVATLRTFPTVLTVPDGARGTAEIAADALTQVTVAATQ